MSEELKDDIITKEPEQPTVKQKNPKKVAAGKRLAEYHKKAKASLEKNRESVDTPTSWPEISLTTALSLVGLTLTVVDLYFRYNKPIQNSEQPKMEHSEAEQQTTSHIPIPRTGMD